MSSERRNFSRIHFSHPATLTSAAGTCQVEVHDISLKGALVTAPTGWDAHLGTSCVFQLPLDGSVVVRMEGTLVHIENGALGIRCDSIDLDSISHLRRLVELNLGDEAMLQRELSVLIHAQ